MIQLKVYPTPEKRTADQLFIDLYDTQPIKLTLSIEDITDADATSVFSRTFKVPATRHNNLFFENAFEVNGVDYDVTIKKPAEILVDGAEFRQGHIRLQKIFINDDQDKTDYELLFLGETRDFSTVIGDATLCQLVMEDLKAYDQNGVARNPNAGDVRQSWQAYPENASVDANGFPDAGFSDGNVIFPLIDHGNTYDEEGAVQGPQMVIGGNDVNSFTKSGYAMPTSRLKPMIRAKRIWDQIFQDAGYTYSSDFIESPRFHQMYVSAFGNQADIGYSTQSSGENLMNAEYTDQGQNPQYMGDYLYLPDNIYDPGGNFTVGNLGMGSYYTCGATAVGGDANVKYRMTAQAFVFAEREVSCPGFCTEPVTARLELFNISTGQVLKSSQFGYNQQVGFTFDTELDNITINSGSNLAIRVEPYGGTDYDQVYDIRWQVQEAPGVLLPSTDLACDYKQIDYIKDVLKMFRLVLAPDRNNANNFIVEPWQTYINSGDLHDWSHKLVKNKDVVLEPLFNTQSEEIEYSFQDDEDYVNVYHQEQYKHPYGWLKFDSQNELLKGTRKIETIEIAPTPMATIRESSVNTNHSSPGWIFPQLYSNESEDSGNQHLPIVPKTRFLFYNGLVDIPQPGGGNLGWWMANDATSPHYDYPLMSSFENWPQTQDGLNLNWANDVNYWAQTAQTSIFDTPGLTLYSEYWSRYINSLYGKFSRRMTAYFVLNNVDLQELSFDDTIFVNGKYWRPEKIIDVNIGERTEVKVQLISANDFVPSVYIDQPLTNFSVTSTDELCGCDGIISVSTDGATPFSWTLSPSGLTGTAATTGGNPQQFDIEGICEGSYTLEVVDDLGRSNQQNITVNGSANPPLSATWTQTDDTSCGTSNACTGSITVTPAGGSGGNYEVQWTDDETGATRTGLCGGQSYTFRIEDGATSCLSDTYTVEVLCGSPVTIHKLAKHINCQASSSEFYYAQYDQSLAIGTTVDLVELPGCYYVIGYEQSFQLYTIENTYPDCATCAGVTPPQKFKLEACPTRSTDQPPVKWLSAADNPNLTLGQVVNVTGDSICYEVTALAYNNNAVDTLAAAYDSCTECQQDQINKYTVVNCSGFDSNAVIQNSARASSDPDPSGVIVAMNPPSFDENNWFHSGVEACYPNDGYYVPTGTGLSITWSGTATLEQNPNENVPSPPKVRILDYDSAQCNITGVATIIEPEEGYTWPSEYTSRPFQYLLTYNFEATSATTSEAGVFLLIENQPGEEQRVYWGDNVINVNDASAPQLYMAAEGQLTIGSVVNIQGQAGCFEVTGVASPNVSASYTYDTDGGVYESCATCTGTIPQQTCHQFNAVPFAGAEVTYVYDNGQGPATYIEIVQAGGSFTFCAFANSVHYTGIGTLSTDNVICFPFTDPVTGDVGTTCDTAATPTKYCYEITATALSGFSSAAFNWFEDNVFHEQKLRIGNSLDICADEGTVQVVYGSGTITGGTEACSSSADCQPNCNTYAYEGPQQELSLLFIDCDGNRGFFPNVYDATVNEPDNVIPACIAIISGGTAAPFLTPYALCT